MLLIRSLRKRKLLTLTVSVLVLIFIFDQAEKTNTVPSKSLPATTFYRTSWTNTDQQSIWSKLLSVLPQTGEDVVGTVRELEWFEKCVLYNNSITFDAMNAAQTKVFPYLNFELITSAEIPFGPVWRRWNKQVYINSTPRFSMVDDTFTDVEKVHYDTSKPFWRNWLELMTQTDSRGVVISVSDRQAADAVRLIRVLRHLKNSLPIQITHKGDLSEYQQELLIEAARKGESDAFPPQELWFADIKDLLKPTYVEKFRRFSNKWLALLFCPFERPIIMDADTVPFSSLDQYYDFPQFKAYGCLMFKDRQLVSNKLSIFQRRTLKRVAKQLLTKSTSTEMSDQELYSGIKDPIALEALKNMFEERHKHHVDSGLVLIDKKSHLFDILTSFALQFSSMFQYFHGDKDWFWISQLLRGVPYTFYPVEASSVGKLEEIHSDNEAKRYKICSIQLAHTGLDDSILWVNGGLNTCKLYSWQYDYKRRKSISSTFDTPEALRDYYQTDVQLEAVIIPEVEKRPWLNTDLCARYEYCAFYHEGKYGKLIRPSDAQRLFYRQTADVWHNEK